MNFYVFNLEMVSYIFNTFYSRSIESKNDIKNFLTSKMNKFGVHFKPVEFHS